MDLVTLTSIVRTVIYENFNNRYISYYDAFSSWYKNRNKEYAFISIKEASRLKTSDTIFILGSGPDLNRINGHFLAEVRKHDSFGINFSILKKEINPTFQIISYETVDIALKYLKSAIEENKERLSGTVFMLNSKVLSRMAHPRTTPYFFPSNPICCPYLHPESINFTENRPFSDDDFEKTLVYRNTLSVVLHLIVKLGYKNIVLVGVQPDTRLHFFYGMQKMKEYVDFCKKEYLEQNGHLKKRLFPAMIPKQGKIHPIDKYIYSLSDFLERKKGVKLYTAFAEGLLYSQLPSYFESLEVLKQQNEKI